MSDDAARDSMSNFMLGQDVAGSILPPAGRSDVYQLHVSPPSSYDIAAGVFEGTGRWRQPSSDFAMMISRIAQVVAAYGADAYEIVADIDDDGAPAPGTSRICPGTWSRDGRNLVQVIPETEVSSAAASRVVVPDKQYAIVEMRRLPARYWEDLIVMLAQIDRGIMRQMTPSAIGKINVLERIELRDAALLRATRDIGWTGRLSNLTHGYFNYRTLVFRRFIAELRGEIVDRLNDILAIIGPTAGFKAYFCVDGLASVADFDEALESFAQGRLSWTDVKQLL